MTPDPAERSGWQPVSEAILDGRQMLCGHAQKKWIRFGRVFPPILDRWYYSGTSERSQWAQVEGDAPTHVMPLPPPPKEAPDAL